VGLLYPEMAIRSPPRTPSLSQVGPAALRAVRVRGRLRVTKDCTPAVCVMSSEALSQHLHPRNPN
jgi:hypothetical protein